MTNLKQCDYPYGYSSHAFYMWISLGGKQTLILLPFCLNHLLIRFFVGAILVSRSQTLNFKVRVWYRRRSGPVNLECGHCDMTTHADNQRKGSCSEPAIWLVRPYHWRNVFMTFYKAWIWLAHSVTVRRTKPRMVSVPDPPFNARGGIPQTSVIRVYHTLLKKT